MANNWTTAIFYARANSRKMVKKIAQAEKSSTVVGEKVIVSSTFHLLFSENWAGKRKYIKSKVLN